MGNDLWRRELGELQGWALWMQVGRHACWVFHTRIKGHNASAFACNTFTHTAQERCHAHAQCMFRVPSLTNTGSCNCRRDMEPTYHFSCQFTADLIAMNHADFIITSTHQVGLKRQLPLHHDCI